ncbi:hypothetical protein CHS0354_027922 [Potamilus streckersoni]|uniref:Beta-lactamase-related domain-containing protein n=1 Tax=Potamilus streckersoni TaxID=2493646 RepID=A0AAE0T4H7_9BIVA|nr:hypothetical protein CHS0354_027922 [Potamilus streckersoni]
MFRPDCRLLFSIFLTGLIVHWVETITAAAEEADIFTESEVDDIDRVVNTVMECKHVPGMTLSVVKGNMVWTKGYGMAGLKRMVNNNTLFCIGSLTKAFTSTLLAIQLTDLQGDPNRKITWNTPLQAILGSDFEFVDEYRSQKTTLKDILSHRVGLMAADLVIQAGVPFNVTRAKLSRRIKYLPETDEFRNKFQYNNFMYMLAGHVTEIFGKDTWENLVTSRILKPLGMSDTVFISDIHQVDNHARPYFYDSDTAEFGILDESLFNIYPIGPAGTICSSATDMFKWIRFLLSKGVNSVGERLVSSRLLRDTMIGQLSVGELYQLVMSLQKPRYPVTDDVTTYGMGWFQSRYRGYSKLSHSGGLYSYASRLLLFPDNEFGIFGNVNGPDEYRGGYSLHPVLYFISDLLLGYKPWITINNVCQFPSITQEGEDALKTSASNITYTTRSLNITSFPSNKTPRISTENIPVGRDFPLQTTLTVVSVEESGNKDLTKTVKPATENITAYNYVGMYGHRFFGNVFISVFENGTHHLKYGRLLHGHLSPLSNSIFKLDLPGQLAHIITTRQIVVFKMLGDDGKYNRIEIGYAPEVMTFDRGVSFFDEDSEDKAVSGSLSSSKTHIHVYITIIFFLKLFA